MSRFSSCKQWDAIPRAGNDPVALYPRIYQAEGRLELEMCRLGGAVGGGEWG